MTVSIQEATEMLTAPGAPFEMEEIEIFGIRKRVWKNAPPSLRILLDMSKDHGDKTYLVYEDDRVTYGEHYQTVCKLAHILLEKYNVQKGDRVAIAMRNYPEWPMAFWAATCIGAIAVPLNAWWKGGELEYGLSDSGSTVLFADGERVDLIKDRIADMNLNAVICVRGGESLPTGVTDLYTLLKKYPAQGTLPEATIEPDDEATIFYTSGTMGQPKGALGTHRNVCTNLMSLMYVGARALLRQGEIPPILSGEPPEEEPLSPLLSVPLFHATGCHSTLVANTLAGNKLVMMYKWNPERALELIEKEKITQVGGVPAMVWQLLESPDFHERDTSSIRSIAFGGAPAAPELVRRIKEAFPDVSPGNGYGLTETSSVTTMNLGVDYEYKPDSVGVPVPICDIKVVDENGQAVVPGEIGEFWIKGPNVVKRYWNKPEATAETFTDGWLHSGDVGRIDEEGFVYILDRTKEMLIRGGENIYCVEIEDVLYDHPSVMDAAVVGIPHRILGEEVGAVVQITPGTKVAEEDLKAHVAKHLAAFKVPVRLILQDEPLPRNANGKILKRVIKEKFV